MTTLPRRRSGGLGRPSLRRRLGGIYMLLAAGNLAAWLAAWLLFRGNPVLLGTALLAYGFGLRHAVDADHIAAIDNATRIILQSGRRPVSVGLFFALGHSSVVILASAGVATTANRLAGALGPYRAIASLVGTSVSTLFLFAVAAANFIAVRAIWHRIRQIRSGGPSPGQDCDLVPDSRGVLARLFRPSFRLVSRSWHLFPIGLLFGLGFDTATEIALLGISASQAAHGVPAWSIMVFPALFAAGMALIDTTDGIMMLRAYEWALRDPMRKLHYNLVITSLSVVIAIFIGVIEGLGLLGGQHAWHAGSWRAPWRTIGALGNHFGIVGLGIIGLFGIALGASAFLGRSRNPSVSGSNASGNAHPSGVDPF